MSRKSKLIGTELNGFMVLDSYRKPSETGKSYHTQYVVRCILCGLVSENDSTNVLKGTAVCDCSKKVKPHTIQNKRLYNVYLLMKKRCYNPRDKRYSKYGGRGIRICDEWLDSYDSFAEWSLSNGYQEGLTIDRKDNDGDYSPSNCRWATAIQQQNNKSNNHRIEYDGKTMTAAEWGMATGIDPITIIKRLRRGWSAGEALGFVSKAERQGV